MLLLLRILAVMMAVGIVGVSLYTAYLSIRSRLKGKWWLAAVAVISVTRVDIYWDCGRVVYDILGVVLFGAGMVQAEEYGWIIHIGFPAGALVVLGKLKGPFRERYSAPQNTS